MPASPRPSPEPTNRSPGVVLVPASRFIVRRISLVAGQDPLPQVELALETIGPFTPGQLYYGYRVSRDGTAAVFYAAYRKNIPAADTAAWTAAPSVLPDFAVWLGQAAAVPAGIWLHESPGTLSAIVWDGAGELPAGLMAREITPATREAVRHDLLQEVHRRFGVAAVAARTLQEPIVTGPLGKEGLGLSVGAQSALLAPAQLRTMDVRDKVELMAQRGRHKRDRILWLAFASAVVGLAACVVVEAGLQVSNLLVARQRRGLEANATAVEQIKQANQLAVRMESLASQSLRPFEMLAVLNGARPAAVEFVRASTGGPRQMEIEAQSGSASAPQEYENALRQAPGVEGVELRDFRTTGGRTSFLVAVTFKPGFVGQGGAR